MKKSKYRHSIVKKHLLVMLTAILTVLMFSFSGKVIKADPSKGKNYFISDYENREEVIDKANELNEEIFGEGVVLLKNEDNALPIEPGAKISLFGKNSLSVLQSGSGSSSGTGNKSINMERALIDAGFELNPALINFYRNNSLSGSGRGSAPANTNMPSGYNTGETPVNMYTAEIENSYDSYDVAVVLFQRIAGEGFDLPRKMSWNGNDYRTWSDKELVPGARSKDDHYLQLDKNESDLLKYLGGHFSKVVVLLNTGSQFETGFLDDPNHYGYHENIKAALWIGYPGGTGLNALADVLKGKVNPSGKTVDTWARDFKKDPTWENFGNNLIDYGNQYTNLVNKTDVRAGYRNNYVYYEEGIYVGYRYYETRGYTDGEEWYHEHVVYPFGYGLSYTSFTQEIVSKDPVENSVLDGDGEITISVKVTNTGTVAGKDVVQLYYTAPYYHQGIEKAHVVLGEFGKTKLLQPEESEIITLTIKVQDMASYDYNDANLNEFKGYELDQGDYEIKLMANSHDVIESVKYRLDETISYQNDGASGNKVENRFDDVSAEINREFSRSDWEGTYPVTQLDITAPQYIIDGSNLWFSGNNPSDEGQPYYNDQMPITGNDSGKIKLEDLYEKDYDDPLWEEFLNQLSVDSLRKLAGQGSYRSGIELNELGIKTVVNADSPAGWVNWSYGTGGSTYTLYSSETILASTWNKKLAYDKGRMIGNEALFGNGGPESRFPGWYAPAVNIHRSQFGGRNFEYYSEDGYLSGAMAAEVVKGAQDKGVFAYVKHFGVNEQEIYRVGLMTWATEQSMREIYLKPFEATSI
ncbi:MAG: glycoside hydrolase family 3 C-terminal domain-containing protein [Acholeplasmatales bacterium]|jgi:beta-glucosidase|nr:glycoside hydrolase family 3 C-terminal domain-containing protein [Acholeplasmatales bacterium]